MFVWLPHFQKIFNPWSLRQILKFDVLMPVKIYIMVFWAMTPSSQRVGTSMSKKHAASIFRKVAAAHCFEMSVNICQTSVVPHLARMAFFIGVYFTLSSGYTSVLSFQCPFILLAIGE
jgi:hypothetical protein